jgi:hypothetical protein
MPLIALSPPDFSPAWNNTVRPTYQFIQEALQKATSSPITNCIQNKAKEDVGERSTGILANAGAETRDRSSKKSSPKVETPKFWKLHWDCADTE